MDPTFQNLIASAMKSGVNTNYVNVTWANEICAVQHEPNCTAYLISTFTTSTLGGVGPAGTDTSQLSTCTYPSSNFVPTDCQCHFTCTNGYSQCGTQYCINPATQACQSGAPVPLARRSFVCPFGYSSCPVPGGGSECLDTSSDLESCGGCVHDGGVDCSALPGVSSVSCVSGQCQLYSCSKGYSLVDNRCVFNSM
jgi:hypothetical protein